MDEVSQSSRLANKFFNYGRQATAQLLNDLELTNCNVSLPAYICGSLPKFLEDIGYKVNFYDVLDLCYLNLKELEVHIEKKKPKALFVCHYFGLNIANIQDIRNLANFKNIQLIEDFCHSYESFYIENNKNGKIKNAVFSFRKTLPLSIGAGYHSSELIEHANPNNTHFNSIRHALIERTAKRLGWPNIYSESLKFFLDHLVKIRSIRKNDISTHNSEKCIDSNALSYLNDRYINWSSDIRIKNHKTLYDMLDLDENKFTIPLNICVPQVFIILDTSEKLNIFLKNLGIGVFKWPEKDIHPETINKSLYAGSHELNRRVTCIPIHQDVTHTELRYIAKQINIYYERI